MVYYNLSLVILTVLIFLTGLSSGQKIQQSKTEKNLLYNYSQVLEYSLLFYEAQRSGALPRDNRIPWRKDSCMQCKYNGFDLSGGYYTTGRTLKFTFPNAAATTLLAWGAILHKEAYRQAGLLERVVQAITWGADYLVQCHVGDQLVALVGDLSEIVDNKWNRPEDIKSPSPVQAISPEKPGPELAGEVAAALAASSMVVRETNRPKADEYVRHSEQLNEFAEKRGARYSNSLPDLQAFYKSWGGYHDELVWAAVWLYKATNNATYLEKAEQYYEEFYLENSRKDEFSWDDKTAGAKVLLYEIYPNKYREHVKWFCDFALDSARSSKNGLFNVKPVMALRYSSNAAFLCLELGELLLKDKSENYAENPYLGFTLQQINVALGDTGRSYLVGFGVHYPMFIHHVGSFCPTTPAVCDRTSYFSKFPNPNIVVGALVGGPNRDGGYTDSRANTDQNEIGVDVNAGFQSAVVGLLHKHFSNTLPREAYGCTTSFRFNVPLNQESIHIS